MRRDLRAVLETFVATHRGVRVGRLFGAPAVFAGRRVFAKLDSGGLRLRLAPAARAALKGGPYEDVHSGRAFRPADVPGERSEAAPSASVSERSSRRRAQRSRSFRPSTTAQGVLSIVEGREAEPSGPAGRRPVRSDWVTISPGSPEAARLEMLLEQSARYVALA